MTLRRRINQNNARPPKREVRISFCVRTELYPAELAKATKLALEKAGLEVLSIRAVFVKRKGTDGPTAANR